ncbi:MAG: aminomethyl-transferring glycine dehydrogenase, partial [Porticoccaceae bacterium]|nr:aminomethyl-transferring glycine dehydrogenase [Porticoccaceae bacterium]
MLSALKISSLAELSNKTVPNSIRKSDALCLPPALTEQQALAQLRTLAEKNTVKKSLLGLGYYDTITPPLIQRNVLENPAWYTAYTPYQPEIAQGRLEGLLNYQQMIMDLSGMEMANASMLDEATAAAEAMAMAKRQLRKNNSSTFFVDSHCHPQTIAVVQTRAEHFGFDIVIGDIALSNTKTTNSSFTDQDYFAVLLQNPCRDGQVRDLTATIETIHRRGALAIVATDLMSMVLVKSPGSMGADIVVGSNQRFGIPMGFGGPHAGFFAFRADYKRSAPGRIIGVSIDQRGKPALRMAMQTREQHIRREKANSNICTAQVLLALMSAFYAMYHGPQGLKTIAGRIHQLTSLLAAGLQNYGYVLRYESWFDTLTIETPTQQHELLKCADQQGINLRTIDDSGGDAIAISLDETCDHALIERLLTIFSSCVEKPQAATGLSAFSPQTLLGLPTHLLREDQILSHPVFNLYHSESEMLRYLKRLENRDISLTNSMIPLGSCTMKLNATAEMMPISWPEFANIHPFAPAAQTLGYQQLFSELEDMLVQCTGYDAVSLQPNAGSQGEYAGLIAIKKYHQSRGETQRDICLIPSSAHGTNPASAQMVGMKVVVVKCNDQGDIDIDDLRTKANQCGNKLAALMVTYPSTHGVFESGIVDVCQLIHDYGGQVYIDGANLNAMVGLAEPGKFGGDVSHINLHKTFCIPHGGGGPGMGPIAVAEHLREFLPGHPLLGERGHDNNKDNNTISAAPWGSASILPIAWMYIKMMGPDGLKLASQVAILSANYIARKLDPHYPVLFTGQS